MRQRCEFNKNDIVAVSGQAFELLRNVIEREDAVAETKNKTKEFRTNKFLSTVTQDFQTFSVKHCVSFVPALFAT